MGRGRCLRSKYGANTLKNKDNHTGELDRTLTDSFLVGSCYGKSVVSVVCSFSPCYVQMLVFVVCSLSLRYVQRLVPVVCSFSLCYVQMLVSVVCSFSLS